jgi:hypothetical protein
MGRGVVGVKRREWAERMRRFSALGMTVGDFCDAEGVSVSAFYLWRRKLAAGRVVKETGTTACDLAPRHTFLPVRVVSQSPVLPAASSPISTFTSSSESAFASSPTVPAVLSDVPGPRIEICLTNGVRVLVPTSEAAALRQAILAASQIGSVAESVSC